MEQGMAENFGEHFYENVIIKMLKGEINSLELLPRLRIISDILVVLEQRLGSVDQDVRKRLVIETNIETLRDWKSKAHDVLDAEGASHLIDAIRKASPSKSEQKSARNAPTRSTKQARRRPSK